MTEEKLCYTVERAAGLLDIGVRTLWEEIKQKRIVVFRVGRRILISRDDLIAYRDARRLEGRAA